MASSSQPAAKNHQLAKRPTSKQSDTALLLSEQSVKV